MNLEAFKHAIINSFDDIMQVVSYIEELEGSSIKIWIRDKLKLIDDKDIDKFVDHSIKTAISLLLKKSLIWTGNLNGNVIGIRKFPLQ